MTHVSGFRHVHLTQFSITYIWACEASFEVVEDIAPCQFFLFPTLKKKSTLVIVTSLWSSCHGPAVSRCLWGQSKSAYRDAFQNWIQIMKLCISNCVEYFKVICSVHFTIWIERFGNNVEYIHISRTQLINQVSLWWTFLMF